MTELAENPSGPDRPAGTCCGLGGSWAPKLGEPLVVGCRICQHSTTYWSPVSPDGREEARLR